MRDSQEKENDMTVAELYPQLTEAQQAEADRALHRYLEILRGIFERIQKLTE